MEKDYFVPFADFGEDKFEEKSSKFTGRLWHVETAEQAVAKIKEMRETFWDATHNCYAYILREGNVMRYSDDGEPQGTAGMPILEVLRHENLTDCVCVVTRYFGGILLGTGGLVRAYTQGAQVAVAAAGVQRMSLYTVALIACPYNLYDIVTHLLPEYDCAVEETDYVFDTDFAADLTIMEEGSEFIERFTHKDQYQWPMFTSCCPGWVRFVKSQYPELTDNLSTAKSPQQMFGAVAKSYFAEKVGIDPKRLFVVSIMPCVSKKSECALPTMKNDAGDPDVDVSITTRELNIMMRANHIEPKYLPEEEFDSPLGSATGAAVVFGTTGGVMDAALRSAYFLITGKNPDPDAFTAVRGMDGWKEATFNIPGAGDVRVAVVSSLGKARKLIEAVKRGDAAYDFVEVMACPGGCAGGGGQPIHDGTELAEDRGNVLWRLDQGELLRFSHENPDVKALYKDYLGAPLGEKSHHLLHTDHNAWQMPQKML